MPAPLIDKIWKLIRLATQNPNESESLRAALKACQLIVANTITLRAADGPDQRRPNPFAAADFDFVEALRRERQRQQREQQAAQYNSNYSNTSQAEYWYRHQHTQADAERRYRENYARHSYDCPKKRDPTSRGCCCGGDLQDDPAQANADFWRSFWRTNQK
jgi:hypothetical protein